MTQHVGRAHSRCNHPVQGWRGRTPHLVSLTCPKAAACKNTWHSADRASAGRRDSAVMGMLADGGPRGAQGPQLSGPAGGSVLGGHLRLPVRRHRGVAPVLHRELALALPPRPLATCQTCQTAGSGAAPASASHLPTVVGPRISGCVLKSSKLRASSLPNIAYEACNCGTKAHSMPAINAWQDMQC